MEPQPTSRKDAVVACYRAHHAPLVRLARLLVRDDTVAEDLVQDAFVRLYARWDRLRDPAAAPAYLRATVVNLARGRARRAAIAARFVAEAQAERSAEDVAVRNAEHRAVLAALARLSARQRECLVLRHFAGCSESEIAAAVGCSVGSVRTHLKRGLAQLQALVPDADREARR